MEKLTISQLEEATTIPQGSVFLVEMNDGSGTKKVTKETMAEKIGEVLKIGNQEELQTENKENLVAAINELTQSGGGGASVDILDTPEEIEANTETGKAAGALAMKEMYSGLIDNASFPDGTKFYPDIQNGVRGYNTDAARGADTFHPFKNSANGAITVASDIYWSVTTNGSTNTKTVDVTSVPGYHSLTADNFIINVKSINSALTDGYMSFSSNSYDSDTGILTLSANTTRDSWQGSRGCNFYFDVLCI